MPISIRILPWFLAASAAASAQGWAELGGSATGSGISGQGAVSLGHSIAAGPGGSLLVAWSQSHVSGDTRICVRRWTGTAWVDLTGAGGGEGISGPGMVTAPCVAVDAAGKATVVWIHQESGIVSIRAATLNAEFTYRTPLPFLYESENSLDVFASPSLALDAWGVPFVAWSAFTASGYQQIYVRQYSRQQNRWNELDPGSASGNGISDSLYGSGHPSVAVDPAGRTWIVWSHRRAGPFGGSLGALSDIHVKAWNGSSWSAPGMSHVAGGISGTGSASSPSLAIDGGGSAYVAWTQGSGAGYRVYLKVLRTGTTSWTSLAGSAEGQGITQGVDMRASEPMVRVDAAGIPYVAWRHGIVGNPDSAHLRYFHPLDGTWSSLGGSDEGLGIGATLATGGVSLAIDGDGNPAAVWESAENPAACIYLRRFAVRPTISAPQQFRIDGQTEIPPGGMIVEQNGVVLKGILRAPTGGQVRMAVDIREAGRPPLPVPTSTPAPSDSTVSVTVNGLTAGKTYVWCGWAIDDLGRSGPRSPELEFHVRSNEAPTATGAGQFLVTTGEPLEQGGRAVDRVRFRASLSDLDGDDVVLAIEVRSADLDFSDEATATSPLTSDGEASIDVTFDRSGRHRWQYCAVDQYGKRGSWTTFGDDSSEADFEVVVFGGSAGAPGPCQQSGTAGPAPLSAGTLAALLALGLRSGIVRR